jgi:hypothetical protein
MPRVTVGGRSLELDRRQVEAVMRDVPAEPVREHLVVVDGVEYPPKQVLAVLTGWDRTSFTTMEAQRVLARVGFQCRRTDQSARHEHPSTAGGGPRTAGSTEDRIAALEAGLVVANQAIAALTGRIARLEAHR